MMGQAAPSSPFGALAEGPDMGMGGSDPVQDQLATLMGQIREVATQVDQLAATNPSLAPEAQQIKMIIRQMITKSAQVTGAMQTPSSMDVPSVGA